MDTIARVRRAYFVQKRNIKAIARDLKLARNTVWEIIRADEQTERWLKFAPPTCRMPLFRVTRP